MNFNGCYVSNTSPKELVFRKTNANDQTDGLASSSYIMAINGGQKLEATFDSAVTATAKWSAPLNVAVTYN